MPRLTVVAARALSASDGELSRRWQAATRSCGDLPESDGQAAMSAFRDCGVSATGAGAAVAGLCGAACGCAGGVGATAATWVSVEAGAVVERGVEEATACDNPLSLAWAAAAYWPFGYFCR